MKQKIKKNDDETARKANDLESLKFVLCFIKKESFIILTRFLSH